MGGARCVLSIGCEIMSVYTAEYTHSEEVASVQTRMSSERIFGTEMPTAEPQASQTAHQDEMTASLRETIHWFAHPPS